MSERMKEVMALELDVTVPSIDDQTVDRVCQHVKSLLGGGVHVVKIQMGAFRPEQEIHSPEGRRVTSWTCCVEALVERDGSGRTHD